jgi:pectin methylesterase-like acyl-CoA thioesterase
MPAFSGQGSEERERGMLTQNWCAGSAVLISAVLMAVSEGSARADTLCVDQRAKRGCYQTIGSAIAATKPDDIINVAQGTYREQVIIDKPGLSLIGKNAASTIVDASGNANGVGIYVDGMDNLSPGNIAEGRLSGISEVVVQGFTVANARFEGILVTNASNDHRWSESAGEKIPH